MRSLYLVAGTTMAGVSSVFALLAEIHNEYGIAERDLGWIAGSAFIGALVTQLWLSRYADRGYGGLLMRAGVAASAIGLLWFGLADQLWQFVVARLILGAGVGVIVPASRRYIIVNAGDDQGRQLGAFYGAYLAGFVFGPPLAGALTVAFNVKTPFVIFGVLTAATYASVRKLVIPAVEKDEDGRWVRIAGKVRWQACDDEKCDVPQEHPFSFRLPAAFTVMADMGPGEGRVPSMNGAQHFKKMTERRQTSS